jgi:hypothetical protein
MLYSRRSFPQGSTPSALYHRGRRRRRQNDASFFRISAVLAVGTLGLVVDQGAPEETAEPAADAAPAPKAATTVGCSCAAD